MAEEESVSSRFASKSDAQIQDVMDERQRKNMKNATKVWLNVITYYMKEKKLGLCIDEIMTKDLPNFLYKFYSEVRNQNGQLYSQHKSKSNAGCKQQVY